MLHIQITPSSGVPGYRQIMDQVAYYVASGSLKPGDALPSIRELAGRLAVNPSTVVKAYGELAHQGVVEMRQGKGVYVAGGVRRIPASELKRALRTEARRLALGAKQMGAARDLVHEILDEELDRLEKGGS